MDWQKKRTATQMPPETEYRIRLHFAELEGAQPTERVFDVRVGERTVIEALDAVREAGGRDRAIHREFVGQANEGVLRIALVARQGQPILNGVEISASAFSN